MKDKLEDLPLFTGGGGRFKSNYDFSDALTMDQVCAIFSVDKAIMEMFVEQSQRQELDINRLIEFLMNEYLKQVSPQPSDEMK